MLLPIQVGPLIGKTFNMKSVLPVEKLRSEIDLLMCVPDSSRTIESMPSRRVHSLLKAMNPYFRNRVAAQLWALKSIV